MTKKKRYSNEFKARVALEAIREELTLAELTKKHAVHPNMISGWKRAAIRNMADGFGKDDGGTAKEAAAEIDKLHSVNRQVIGTITERGRLVSLLLLGHVNMPCQPAGGTGFFSERLGSVARNTRQKMVSRDQDLSVRRQCRLLSLVRSGLYYSPKGERGANLRFMEIIHCLAGHVYMPEKGQAIPRNPVVWLSSNGAAYATPRP